MVFDSNENVHPRTHSVRRVCYAQCSKPAETFHDTPIVDRELIQKLCCCMQFTYICCDVRHGGLQNMHSKTPTSGQRSSRSPRKIGRELGLAVPVEYQSPRKRSLVDWERARSSDFVVLAELAATIRQGSKE